MNENTKHTTYKVMSSKTNLMIAGKSFNNLKAAERASNRCKLDTYVETINW